MTDDDDTRLLRGLLAAVTGLDMLPHLRSAGCVLLATVTVGKNSLSRMASPGFVLSRLGAALERFNP